MNQAVFDGIQSQSDTAFYIQLIKNIVPVTFDCFRT